MVQTNEVTGLFQCLGTILLPPEKLLRLPIRFESANRIVITHGCHGDVALKNFAISARAPHLHFRR